MTGSGAFPLFQPAIPIIKLNWQSLYAILRRLVSHVPRNESNIKLVSMLQRDLFVWRGCLQGWLQKLTYDAPNYSRCTQLPSLVRYQYFYIQDIPTSLDKSTIEEVDLLSNMKSWDQYWRLAVHLAPSRRFLFPISRSLRKTEPNGQMYFKNRFGLSNLICVPLFYERL